MFIKFKVFYCGRCKVFKSNIVIVSYENKRKVFNIFLNIYIWNWIKVFFLDFGWVFVNLFKNVNWSKNNNEWFCFVVYVSVIKKVVYFYFIFINVI